MSSYGPDSATMFFFHPAEGRRLSYIVDCATAGAVQDYNAGNIQRTTELSTTGG